MNEFEIFKKVIEGNFTNDEQVQEEKLHGRIVHPIAKHINRICNDKISNLPKGFTGIFVIEETYFTNIEKNITTSLPHLFLFEETSEGHVKLTSYEIPKSISNKDFRNDNNDLKMYFNELKVSEKFTPLVYDYIEGKGFYGMSLSTFGPDTTFLLDEILNEDVYEVNEVLKKGNKVIVGFDSPIIYKRLE